MRIEAAKGRGKKKNVPKVVAQASRLCVSKQPDQGTHRRDAYATSSAKKFLSNQKHPDFPFLPSVTDSFST
jgi:hypothetical protein